MNFETFRSEGSYRKPLQSTRSLVPPRPVLSHPCSISTQHPGAPLGHPGPPLGHPAPFIPTQLHPANLAPTSPQVSIPPAFFFVCVCVLGLSALPSPKSRANFPFCSPSPCPIRPAPDWQGNPIPTLPAEKCLLLQQSQQSQLPSTRCFTIKVSLAPFLFFLLLFSPFPAAVCLHSLAHPRLIINHPWLKNLHKEHTHHQPRSIPAPTSPHQPLMFRFQRVEKKLVHLKED